MPGGRQLDLAVVPPSAIGQEGAVATKNVSISKYSQVEALKKGVMDLYGKMDQFDLVLYFQNPSGPFSNRLRVLREGNLKENGVATGATIVCQTAQWEECKSKGAESLYYMWAADLPRVPEERRVQPGQGEPVKLGQETVIPAPEVLPLRKMLDYSWVDESRKLVKIYITSNEDPLAVAAAASEQDKLVQSEFGQQSLKITVQGKSVKHVLEIEELEHGIVPEECKVKVVAGKKISITLRKAKDDQLWHTLVMRK
uniref:CS domain-containing protein n=1 Tax=Alexandrium monilatum TaxID=311494 RepID=A0A6T1NVB8_9DINO